MHVAGSLPACPHVRELAPLSPLTSDTQVFAEATSPGMKPPGRRVSVCVRDCPHGPTGPAALDLDTAVGRRRAPSHTRALSSPLTPAARHTGRRQSAWAACRPPHTCRVPPCSSPWGDTERKTVQDEEGFVVSSGDKRHVGTGQGSTWGRADSGPAGQTGGAGKPVGGGGARSWPWAPRGGVAGTASSSLGCAGVPPGLGLSGPGSHGPLGLAFVSSSGAGPRGGCGAAPT